MTIESAGGNPLIPDIGMSDPHVRVFDGKLYLYTGHDATPEDRTWVMRDWWVFTSDDLVHWRHAGTVTPARTLLPDDSSDCWACDAAQRNGRTYFYYSDRNRHIGVLVADDPAGPFSSPRDSWLTEQHDPTLLIDDDPDATPYMVFGAKEGGGYFVVRLNDDMISLAEQPRTIEIAGDSWDNAPEFMDKNYLFKAGGLYYLSWGADYATAENIYGPYTCQGRVGEGYALGPYAHGSFFAWRGQFYHIWCRYLRNGYKFRESLLTYCHLRDDGMLVTDTRFLDRHFATGVGRYSAAWDRIEAEWFTEAPSHVTKTAMTGDNLAVGNLRSGDTLRFDNMDFSSQPDSVTADIVGDPPAGQLELRLDDPSAEPIARIPLPAGRASLATRPKGLHNLLLTARLDHPAPLTLDTIRFTPQ